MNNFPLVSIIIPTYNQRDCFERAVLSALNQSYNNIELVIVDDNKEEEIYVQNKKFIEKLNSSKIIYFKNPNNLGSTKSRNKGIELSNGEFITFLDDDDEYLEYKVEKQVNEMIKNDSDFSATNVKIYNENGKLVDERERKYLYFEPKETLFVKHLKYHITSTNALMFKKDFLMSIGCFDDENLGDEFYLMAKAFQKSDKFVHVNECDIKAYIHSTTGLSSSENKIKCERKLFEFKMSFKDLLTRRDIRYIKMRYYAVFAFAYKKSKNYIKCLWFALKSFFTAPISFFTLFNKKGK